MKPDIVFFASQPFHLTIFDGVARHLRGVSWIITMNPEQARYLANRMLVLADHDYHLFPRREKLTVVQVTHGYSDKNNSYHPLHTHADWICVCGPFQQEEYERRGVIPRRGFWLTGYPPNDTLFSGSTAARPAKLAADRPTLLYAPTWNEEFNSVERIGRRLPEVLGAAIPEAQLIIKPHPAIPSKRPDWMELWRRQAQAPNVYLEENVHSPIAPLMLASDMMLTDVSAVIFQFLILNRPIMLYDTDHPDKERSFSYSPDGIEWRFRDLGYRFTRPESLMDILRSLAAGADSLRPARERYRELLYNGLTGGQAGKRIADKLIMELQGGGQS